MGEIEIYCFLVVLVLRSDTQAGKGGQKNGPSPNFCVGLRIDPINMFQVFLGLFLRQKKFGPSETQFAQIYLQNKLF